MLFSHGIYDNHVAMLIIESYLTIEISFHSISMLIIESFMASLRIYFNFIPIFIKFMLFAC